MNQPHLSFSSLIEKVSSRQSAPLYLPEPNSGNFSLRLSRFPRTGPETIIDIYKKGKRVFISVTRFLDSLRSIIRRFDEQTGSFDFTIPIEISTSETTCNELLLKEVFQNKTFELENGISKSQDDDHYFLFFTDSINCIATGMSNPYERKHEFWIRIINRSYGSELHPPRRKYFELMKSYE